MTRTPRSRIACLALSIVAAATPVASCRTTCEPKPISDAADAHENAPLTEQLADMLTGSFSSAEQAATDPDNYRDIRLHAARIWTDRTDGPWIYVEQAAASALDRPYRQRVYRIVQESDTLLRSDVYTLPADPLRFAGAWRDPAMLDSLTPDSITLREGCSVYLAPTPAGFVGGTRSTSCASDLAGAAYATSVVTLTPGLIASWDQGFDADGDQVWGATAGGYLFYRAAD